MGLPSKNPRDPRTYRHFARMDATGAVAAIVELADGAAPRVVDQSTAFLVEVTDLYPYDFRGVMVDLPPRVPPPSPPVVVNPDLPTPTELAALAAYRVALTAWRRAHEVSAQSVYLLLKASNMVGKPLTPAPRPPTARSRKKKVDG